MTKTNGFVEAAKELANAFAPGFNNIVSDIGSELSRLGVQGQMEAAAALFNGNAFVPYGPGAYSNKPEQEQQQTQEQGRELGGREL